MRCFSRPAGAGFDASGAQLCILRWDEALAKAVGMSVRTYQRHASGAARPLNPEQVGEPVLAEILARARPFSGQEAEQWLERPPPA
jgi:uncharacterized protein (DUF2384 family)